MPANFVVDVTVDNIIDAIAAVLQPLASGYQIVRGSVNRVSPPPDPYIRLQEHRGKPLATPSYVNNGGEAQTYTITEPTQIDIQADIYGLTAGDVLKAIQAVFRTPWFVDQFDAYTLAQSIGTIEPLYCSEGTFSAIETGEQQYDQRWTFMIYVQYNPKVVVPQQSATSAEINIFEAADLGAEKQGD
jgi:hypothetical protein